MLLEIIATSVEDAIRAEAGGAHRLEVVHDLRRDGLTPPYALVEAILKSVSIPIRVMVRPQNHFHGFSRGEVLLIRQDVRVFCEMGVDGVVIGLLTHDHQPDIDTLREILTEHSDIGVTFHRAFDRAADPFQALDVLIDSGLADRVLTSAQAKTAVEGIEQLAALQRVAGDRLRLIAAGGITVANIVRIAAGSGVQEFHVGRGVRTPEAHDGQVDARKVEQLVRALDSMA
ncbi:MAG: copper homeostasis protein CutC [candidate division KSB1 bacterium]|nr:copper homeostasis protein CutC [candidate division KSB1 bacterium]MDQ7064470.1 copper homeostasis protein CutC [candidate division KSB1 bacterium]